MQQSTLKIYLKVGIKNYKATIIVHVARVYTHTKAALFNN